MQIQSYSPQVGRSLSSRGTGFQPGRPEDLVSISGQKEEMFDGQLMGKMLGGMIGAGVGFAGGAVVGGIGGTAIGNYFGHPILGVTLGLIGCGLAGAAIGAKMGAGD